MRAAIDTEPAPSVAPGLGAGSHPQAGTACTEFISLPISAAQFGDGQRVQQAAAPSNPDNPSYQPRESAARTGGLSQASMTVGGNARRRFKEAHHVH